METQAAHLLGQYSAELLGNVLAGQGRALAFQEEAAKETQEPPFLQVILG